MANALGEFLGGVATAIRDMTGDPPEVKMKPVDFSEKIRSIETGADVSGVTATAGDVLRGKVFVDSEGNMVKGTIPILQNTENLYTPTKPFGVLQKGYSNGTCTIRVNYKNETVTPTKETQTFVGTTEFIKNLTVNPIPDEYQNVANVTATAEDVRAGKVFVDSDGNEVEGGLTGTIADVSEVTAKAEDVLEGKVIVDSTGCKVTGTLSMASTGGVDVSGVTATAGDVLEGKVFVDAQGKETVGTFIYDVPGANETVLVRKQQFNGFLALSDMPGLYSPGFVSPPLFALEEGRTYRVHWDGQDFDCEAVTVNFAGLPMLAVGNLSMLGMQSNNEPFVIAYNPGTDVGTIEGNQLFAFDDAERHMVGIYLDEGPVEGVDPYYSQLAFTLMTRNAKNLSGNDRILQLKGYKTPEGATLGNLLNYSFAGFSDVEGMTFSDLMIVQDNVFYGCANLKVLDFTVTNGIGMMLMSNSLNTCNALEAVIFRGESAFNMVNFSASHGSAANFYIYVPKAYYSAIMERISSMSDGNIKDTSRYRKLEDYPEVDNWISQYQ